MFNYLYLIGGYNTYPGYGGYQNTYGTYGQNTGYGSVYPGGYNGFGG